MDFTFTEDQREFRALLRSFVDREIIPIARDWEQAGRYPTEIVQGMAGLGLFGITVPEEYGGLDLDPVSFALVFEEVSRGWMGIAGILGSHSLACKMIAVHGTDEQKRAYLPELATGARRTGIGLTSRTRAPTCRASVRRRVSMATTTWSTAPRCGSPTRAWALIIATMRAIVEEDRAVKDGRWQALFGREIAGATLGVVGLGRLGREIARIGQFFGMRVIAWSQNLEPLHAAEVGVEAVADLRELCRLSDVVSIHLRLSDRTRGLIGAEELRALGPRGHLVNTSRGPIVDEDASCAPSTTE